MKSPRHDIGSRFSYTVSLVAVWLFRVGLGVSISGWVLFSSLSSLKSPEEQAHCATATIRATNYPRLDHSPYLLFGTIVPKLDTMPVDPHA